MFMKNSFVAALVLVVGIAGCAESSEEDPTENNDQEQEEMDGSIIGVADDAGSFTTLLAAVDAAGNAAPAVHSEATPEPTPTSPLPPTNVSVF